MSRATVCGCSRSRIQTRPFAGPAAAFGAAAQPAGAHPFSTDHHTGFFPPAQGLPRIPLVFSTGAGYTEIEEREAERAALSVPPGKARAAPGAGAAERRRSVKQRHVCPKCGSSDILRIPGSVGAYGVGNNIQVGFSNFSAVPVQRYLCCGCGYSEEWIDREDIPKLKKKYG